MTYTYAILDISQGAWDEIHSQLEENGYQHAFHEHDGKIVIDMHGIAVRADPEKFDRLETILQEMEAAYNPEIPLFREISKEETEAVHQAFPGFVDRCSASMGRDLAKVIRRKMKESDE